MILLIAEHDHSQLNPATRHALTAAAQIGGEVDLLVAGAGCGAVATQAAALAGVARVLCADAAHYRDQTAENLAALVAALVSADLAAATGRYSHLLAPAGTFGKNLLPRVAALAGVAQVSDVVAVVSADTFVTPIYAGNLLATVRAADPLKVLTVRSTAFAAAPDAAGSPAPVEPLPAGPDLALTRVVDRQLTVSARPDLASARVIVSGGRGLGSGESFRALLEPLADRLGAALGASRAAVDAGYVPNDFQVGQTGKVVAPELYIAVGISGAIQHLAGMKDSKVIVAINRDAEAPIFQVADYGLVGDLFELVPQLTAALR
jgi:electron transfer flavoprotein alpha subunit